MAKTEGGLEDRPEPAGKERLLKLAEFLERVPRKSFNMEVWVSRRGAVFNPDAPGSCGFAGCAIGWAAHAELFPGFTIDGSAPVYHGARNWDAVSDLMGLPRGSNLYFWSKEAGFLFADTTYPKPPTPKQVAERIRAFVANNGV